MLHTFYSFDRDYNNWTITPPLDSEINPIKSKLLSGDVFYYNSNVVGLKTSPVRSYDFHCGVLILYGNKTFGKTKNNRTYYKCIPNDKTLPIFLIPYDLNIGFHKDYSNKYIMFQFRQWDGKHPIGCIRETFGNVDNYSSFCSYRLWCNKLVYSIAKFKREVTNFSNRWILTGLNFNDIISNILHNEDLNEDYGIEEHQDKNVFTIDPEGSKDLDDGFSVVELDNGNYKISIYIANVYIMLHYMGWWDQLTDRVSTIYLPEDRRTLLPDLLSDDYFSLIKNNKRIVFAMEFIYSTCENSIQSESTRFFNAVIHIKENYTYEEENLINNPMYKTLFQITKNLNNDILDSHDVVSHWMIYMNTKCAEKLQEKKTGIFRIVSKKDDSINNKDDNKRHTINLWNNLSGSYEKFSEDLNMYHEVLDVKSYLHITSPIRRVVDIVNQAYFFKHIFSRQWSEDCKKFITKFESKIQQLNADVKAIRKVQSECDFIYLCKNDSTILDNEYDGYIFNKSSENIGFCYHVYITSLKKISMFRSNEELILHETYKFKLYLFDRENNGDRKIRLGLI